MKRIYAWRRLALALGVATVMGLLISPQFVFNTPAWQVIAREMVLSLSCLTAFGIFEKWPKRLPRWMARWAIQVLAVAIVIPPTVFVIYAFVGAGDPTPFWKSAARVNGMVTMIGTGLLVAPWTAVAALFNQRDFAARNQPAVDCDFKRFAGNFLDFQYGTWRQAEEVLDGQSQSSDFNAHLQRNIQQ